MNRHSNYYYWQRMIDNFKDAKGCSVGFAEGELSLRYHDTVVARYYFDTDTLVLDHGGWLTYYTKERINRFCTVLDLNARLYQHRKVWHVATALGSVRWCHIMDAPDTDTELSIEHATRPSSEVAA
jgi:hypothetical protein